ncbi:unnamed protein product [Vitrella brassicaformis CCMP3155]|uniref:subtilisin n=4 Tax=Vitrella brassicaformis TaxID=1169539 RepID=A0A0G4FC41_VITBC|nr:unnamed protein product [Vitrella brassicaformis CCMP3155]|eukprot:CEM10777.1 unnamed protein product [Vitrella brassicaformis CCMP3155]
MLIGLALWAVALLLLSDNGTSAAHGDVSVMFMFDEGLSAADVEAKRAEVAAEWDGHAIIESLPLTGIEILHLHNDTNETAQSVISRLEADPHIAAYHESRRTFVDTPSRRRRLGGIYDDLDTDPIDLESIVGPLSQEQLASGELGWTRASGGLATNGQEGYPRRGRGGAAAVLPDDPLYNESGMWWVDKVSLEEAWAIHRGTNGIVVAVVDGGINYDHPDLRENIWVNPGEVPGDGIDNDGNGYVDDVFGWNFVDDNNDPMAIDQHGTHIAGLLAARGNNSEGVVGVTWGARLMAIKAVDDRGHGRDDAFARGWEYAARMGAKISTASFGWRESPFLVNVMLRRIVRRLADLGHLIVTAAGNSNEENDSISDDGLTIGSRDFPCGWSAANVLCVGSSLPSDEMAGFSNVGKDSVDLVAPGVEILSTFGDVYRMATGTSISAPIVAGVAALVWDYLPELTATKVATAVVSSADYSPHLMSFTKTSGRVNAHRALLAGMQMLECDVLSLYSNSSLWPAALSDQWQKSPARQRGKATWALKATADGDADTSPPSIVWEQSLPGWVIRTENLTFVSPLLSPDVPSQLNNTRPRSGNWTVYATNMLPNKTVELVPSSLNDTAKRGEVELLTFCGAIGSCGFEEGHTCGYAHDFNFSKDNTTGGEVRWELERRFFDGRRPGPPEDRTQRSGQGQYGLLDLSRPSLKASTFSVPPVYSPPSPPIGQGCLEFFVWTHVQRQYVLEVSILRANETAGNETRVKAARGETDGWRQVQVELNEMDQAFQIGFWVSHTGEPAAPDAPTDLFIAIDDIAVKAGQCAPCPFLRSHGRLQDSTNPVLRSASTFWLRSGFQNGKSTFSNGPLFVFWSTLSDSWKVAYTAGGTSEPVVIAETLGVDSPMLSLPPIDSDWVLVSGGERLNSTLTNVRITCESYIPTSEDIACDFENGFCGWEQDSENDTLDWSLEVAAGKLRTADGGEALTGDHTMSSSGVLYAFLYVGPFGVVDGREEGLGRLISPIHSGSDDNKGFCLQVHYQLTAPESTSPADRLAIYVVPASTGNYTSLATSRTIARWTSAHLKKRRRTWHVARLFFSSDVDFRVVIEGHVYLKERGGGLALDDIMIWDGGCPEVSCSFEGAMCGYRNDLSDTEAWSTGPQDLLTDVTSLPRAGYFSPSYLWAWSSGMEGSTRITSPPEIPSSPLTKYCLQFAYHLFGSAVGSLTVTKTEDGVSRELWAVGGLDHGDSWQLAMTRFSASSAFNITFEATRNGASVGSKQFLPVAIDEVQLVRGSCEVCKYLSIYGFPEPHEAANGMWKAEDVSQSWPTFHRNNATLVFVARHESWLFVNGSDPSAPDVFAFVRSVGNIPHSGIWMQTNSSALETTSYFWLNIACADTDPCADSPPPTDAEDGPQECPVCLASEVGEGYGECLCFPGSEYAEDGVCVDIDECALPGVCDEMASCENRLGAVMAICVCPDGFYEDPTTFQCIKEPDVGDVRLVDGSDQASGRVEFYGRGSWGTICPVEFSFFDADVICRQLGAGKAMHILTKPHKSLPDTPPAIIWLHHLRCKGHEQNLLECGSLERYGVEGSDVVDCGGQPKDLWVRCEASDTSALRTELLPAAGVEEGAWSSVRGGALRGSVGRSKAELVGAPQLLGQETHGTLLFDRDLVEGDGSGGSLREELKEALQESLTLLYNFRENGMPKALKGTSFLALPTPRSVGALAKALGSDDRAAIRSFVESGGVLILQSDMHTVPNTVFNWTITSKSDNSIALIYCDIFNFTEAARNNSRFAQSPEALLNRPVTSTVLSSSLPDDSLSLYECDGHSASYAVRRGEGWVVGLGWDWSVRDEEEIESISAEERRRRWERLEHLFAWKQHLLQTISRLTSPPVAFDTNVSCSDGLMNGDEQNSDCGGSCQPCVCQHGNTSYPVDTQLLYDEACSAPLLPWPPPPAVRVCQANGNFSYAPQCAPEPVEGEVRLDLGRGGMDEGRVVIYRDGKWGIVCGDHRFTLREAQVVCRHLGYEVANRSQVTAYREPSLGLSIFSIPDCDGSEESLAECSDRSHPSNALVSSLYPSGEEVTSCHTTIKAAAVRCHGEAGTDGWRKAYEAAGEPVVLENNGGSTRRLQAAMAAASGGLGQRRASAAAIERRLVGDRHYSTASSRRAGAWRGGRGGH